MSSIHPLTLPKFHVSGVSQTLKDQSPPAPNRPREEAFGQAKNDPLTEPELAAEQAESAMPEPAPIQMPPEIDTGMILNGLAEAVGTLERVALQHSEALVSEFLRSAFPKLCETLLAEEVSQAINSMSPKKVEKLILSVPLAFESAFQRTVQSSPDLQKICEIHPIAGDRIEIDVDWQTGGLHFDLDQFLESSLVRLNGLSHTQEGQDV